ncbi:hypothetical protein CROQUDRAFT_720130 [Cronartium quercuum f. sp. fusiforme G11]|uniref:Uncharacterized protein n=1 Tax=Cronartium quercuum f. sp. fusiforme G11 TaxID=708437 RepID=A0A9P6TFZ1_9BASI|nr:hypothetical protein CROQUDRAFT_720130 [Cronartium quercuum f. sp. fusiforme G11]
MVLRSNNPSQKSTNTRPFPPGFTPVLPHNFTPPTLYLPPEAFEPTFLSPNLRSPILDSSNRHHHDQSDRPSNSGFSSSSTSSQALKLIKKSVSKLNHHRRSESQNEMDEKRIKVEQQVPKLMRSRSLKSLSRSPSLQFHKRSKSGERLSEKRGMKGEGEEEEEEEEEKDSNLNKRFEETIESIEELETEAIKLAICEKGHKRQRSKEMIPLTSTNLNHEINHLNPPPHHYHHDQKQQDWLKLRLSFDQPSFAVEIG